MEETTVTTPDTTSKTTQKNAPTNLTRAECRERAALLRVEHTSVHIDISNAERLDEPTFGTRSVIDVVADRDGETFVDFIGDSVEHVGVEHPDDTGDAPAAQASFDGARVRLSVRAGRNRITIAGRGVYSRSGEGLHRFQDPADDLVYLYTQFEPTDARRLFPTFDQPDLKSTYAFTVDAPAHFTVLNNSAPVSTEEIGSSDSPVTRTVFGETKVFSSYITCICAGPYASAHDEYVDESTGQTIPLGVYARQSLAPYMEADDVFEVTKQGFDFYTREFAYPYPWGKYDQIFVPEYNLGAMENPGLVTFVDDYLHRDRATRADYMERANTILHEMAHMWFGDLVTMRWWDDLWLKESFADYMASLSLVEATRFDDAWVAFAMRRKDWAYRQDQYPTTHPIVADIPDVEAARLNFDGITYAKGASVLKALVSYVGRDAFRAGTREYFRRHAFGNTSLEDFLSVLDEAAPDSDVRAWAAAWLQTPGTSTLTLSIEDEEVVGGAGSAAEAGSSGSAPSALVRRASVSQRDHFATGDGPGTLRPHRFALAAFDRGADGRLALRETWDVELTGESAEIPALAGTPRADLYLLNYGDGDFAKVRLDERSLAVGVESAATLADPMDRALVLSALINAARDGLMPVGELLRAFSFALPTEDHPAILKVLTATVTTALDQWVPAEERHDAVAAVLESVLDTLPNLSADSDEQIACARFALELIARTAGSRLTDGDSQVGREAAEHVLSVEVGQPLTAFAPGLTVDHALRWSALRGLVVLGWADEEDIAAEAALDKSGSGRLQETAVRAARPLAIARERAFAEASEDRSLSNDAISARIAGFRSPSAEPLAEACVERYFELLEEFWSTRSIEIGKRLTLGLFPSWSTRARRVAGLTDAWLQEHADAPTAQRRLLIEARDDLGRAMRLRGDDAHAGEAASGSDAQSGAAH